MASGDSSATIDTTGEFLRSFSVVRAGESDSDSDFDELSPIPETPGEGLDFTNADSIDEGDGNDQTLIPFASRFRTPVAFSTSQRDNCWIPGLPIAVTIESFERHAALKMLHPNLYAIRVKHGVYEWVIHRRYKHFRQLHDSLTFFRARYKLPLPNKEYHERRRTIMKDLKGMKERQRQQKSVRLPKRPEYLVGEDRIPSRMKQLEQYLQNLVTCRSYRNHPATLEFFEVSSFSFINKLGAKSKEGLIEKCSGGRRINIQCCGCLQNLHFAGTWNNRWLIVKDNFIGYIRPEDGELSDVMLMDSAFKVKCGLSNTGAKHGVQIENMNRKLLIKCWTSRKGKEWAEMISSVAQNQALEYTQRNRFESYAPTREKEFARWFVDGRSYFEAVADALEKAREEIYITDWWLSPEIYLKRPIVDGDKWRLDVILKRKAEQGVKIFILLYKEIEAALTIKSIYSKQTLMSQCPENIKVLRHPDHIPGTGVLLWAHHEKVVVIDQQIAFTGGLDLCYGRWDDDMHRMKDLGSVSLKPPSPGGSPLSAREHSSHTELSVMTSDENLSAMDTGPSVIVTPADKVLENGETVSQHKSENHSDAAEAVQNTNQNGDLVSGSAPDCDPPAGAAGVSDSPSSTNRNVTSEFAGQPVEANVVVKGHELCNDADTSSTEKGISASDKQALGEDSREVDSPAKNDGVVRQQGQKQLLRQQSSIVDMEGFSESAIDEINESMQPFKEIGDLSHFKASTADGSSTVAHEEVTIVVHQDSIDKEIVCSPFADDPKRSPVAAKKSSRSPLGRRKKKDAGAPSGASSGETPSGERVIKASHLWKRRSKNKRSLELVIPENKGIYRKTEDSSGGGTSLKTEHAGGANGLPANHDEEKPRADSNSSAGSRASNSDLITSDKQTPVGKEPNRSKENSTPGTATSLGGINFSGAANAMNALRKMLHLKEENNNDGGEGDNGSRSSADDPSHAARRRWKMIFNVSKFESMVRTPQVPERVDERLFYNQNVKFPTSKSRLKLVQSFREGVDKLKRHERKSSLELYEKGDLKDRLPVPPSQGGLQHTSSEEDILERGLLGSTKLWIGKDYVNFIYKDFVNLEQPFEDFIDRTKCPRMPWHDIGCVLYGKSARDLARHFIGRWNFTKLEKCKKNPNFPLLTPKTTTKVYIPRLIRDITFEVKVQVLRSCTGWSAGVGETENSIHKAYEHCIENARDFIYIENQFFITQTGTSNTVHNCIGNALYKRILRAHRSSSAFKVYVVMPLLPAFEGEFGTNTGAALQAVTHWNYSSICRGENSLMHQLAREIPDPNKYIVFCGLRTWDKLDNKLMTELIYVHSKLMIVDDDTVIIGSANINDRSLLGPRDSEIAVMFEDIHKVDVVVNEKQYQAGRFASSLRWTIFREHLGLLHEADFVDLTDITRDSFYKDVWIRRAAVNTTCYDKVFRCLPTDNVKNFSELRQYQSVTPLAQIDQEESMKWLNKIRGHLVLIPLQFLHQESLTPKVGQKEALLPTYLWT
ncbi:phospholipase D1 [Aplysia californica]|uniref:Phospholipase n=2 Tax=Aplysia californica TaxID=6500 RepID=A0ABM1AB51_APLCA|nr:phospholipase D1 [Aplysia californica]